MWVKPEHVPKVLDPILVIFDGIVIPVRLLAALNIVSDRPVKPEPIVAESKPLQFQKAEFPTDCTLSGIVIEVRQELLENAAVPISVTESGIVMEEKQVYAKA